MTALTRSLASAAVMTMLAGAVAASEPAAPSAPAESSREDTERALQAAQQKLEAAVRDVEQLSQRLGAHYSDHFMRGPMVPPRAMLGVQIANAEDGKAGALVKAVSPGGPGEAAGLKEGDLITAIDGKDLTKGPNAGQELVEAMRDREPDRAVKVRLLRDGKSRDIDIVPRAAPRVMMLRRAMPGQPPMPPMPGAVGGPTVIHRNFVDSRDFMRDDGPPGFRGSPIAGMELATLSEQLGTYFGTKKGVLVVRAGASDAWKLKDGDVIQAVDGREPDSASHATRILLSYGRGEKLQLKVLRERKPVTLDVTLPGERRP